MTLDDFLQHEIDVGSFPSAAYAIGSSRGIERENALGHAVAVPMRIPATLDTLYDCASITKPLITTTLALQLLDLDPYVRSLLTHTSGMRAWLPLYLYDNYLDAIRDHGPEYEPGTRVIYSDLNFVLLWSMLPNFVELARERILAPLGIEHDAMFNPPPSQRPRIAATEWGQRYEAKMAAVSGQRSEIRDQRHSDQRSAVSGQGQRLFAQRDGLIWGETHDGNSHFAGGTAGNAGLFATARAIFRLAQSWTNAELLPRALVDEATSNLTPNLEDARGLGWQKPTGSLATSMLTDRAYGHTGFTGTSVWIEPERDRIMVLLTNRVHPCAAPIAMQRIRGEFHRWALTYNE
ncbi:MAG TPA: serine hydrolase domain-containing protein [Thermoanaerobaculia bacterium]|nr:serine hydrolase domain-containing protein [Thermoanaerobaculia bacterium]